MPSCQPDSVSATITLMTTSLRAAYLEAMGAAYRSQADADPTLEEQLTQAVADFKGAFGVVHVADDDARLARCCGLGLRPRLLPRERALDPVGGGQLAAFSLWPPNIWRIADSTLFA